MPHPVKRWKRNEGSEKGLDSINRKKFRESQRKLFHQHAENLSPMREGYVQREESEENEWPGRACFVKDLKNHPWRCQFKKKKKKRKRKKSVRRKLKPAAEGMTPRDHPEVTVTLTSNRAA